MPNAMDVIVFEVGGRRLALDLSQVQEVFTLGYVTALPVVSDALRGATNLRGRMIPVVSLEPLFGLPLGSWVRPGAPAILISTGEATAAIPVQRVLDVISIPLDRYEEGGQGSGPLVPGSFRGVAGSTPLLSPEVVLQTIRRASADANLRIHQRHEARG